MTFNSTAPIPDIGRPPLPYTLNVVDAAVPVRLPILPVERVSIIRFGDNVIRVLTTVAIVTVLDDENVRGPLLFVKSETAELFNLAITVPSDVQVMVTFIEIPDDAEGENVHPSAVPEFEKSLLEIPDTNSLKFRVYSSVRDEDGDVGEDHVAVGGVVSFVIEEADASIGGLGFKEGS